VFALRNLIPVVALLLMLGLANDTHATDGIEAYNEGNFINAEATWRDALAAEPTDWVARHNLALALAQQQRWGEAGAHAAVAYVQNPRDESVRWHLNYFLERSGYTPPVIGQFMHPGWPEKLAREASPGEWQLLFIGGALLGALSLALVVAAPYGLRFAGQNWVAWSGGVLSIALMAGALFSLQIWGTAANSRAVLTYQAGELRSIPTDLEGDQEVTPLSAGSLAVVQKSFLGWRQLRFPNGQTGWVRVEELVPLWDRQVIRPN
jgi:tetratricopeptide (TPR) repeat protein